MPVPVDPESVAIILVYNSTPIDAQGPGSINFNYLALKDNLRWRGMSRKRYVPVILECLSRYIKGLELRS